MAFGRLIADERIYEVRGIRLRGGSFQVQAHRAIDRDEPASKIREFVVLGDDGQLVYRSHPERPEVPLPAVGPGYTITVWLSIEVVGHQGVYEPHASS